LVDAAALRLRRELRAVLSDARQRLANIERHEFFRRPTDRVNQLRQLLDDRQRQLALGMFERFSRAQDRVSRLAARLGERHPRNLIGIADVRLAALAERLRCAAALGQQARAKQIDALAARLNALGPEQVLKRGYSITMLKKGGAVVRDASQVRPGDKLVTRLAEGQIESVVEDSRQLRLFE
jgi:exodeoxyribonuclease VII large subunit